MSPRVIEGTWEEIKRHEAELIGHWFRLIPLSETEIHAKSPARKGPVMGGESCRRVSAMGKYAGILSSEEFALRKQEEIDQEERTRS